MSSFRTSGKSVFDIIITEHRLVESVHEQIKSKFNNEPTLEGNRELLLLCFTLVREICIHAHKEHLLLYPLFERLNQVNAPQEKQELADPRKSWDHALQEHLEVEKAAQQIELLCDQVAKTQTSGAPIQLPQQLLQMVNELMENVEHHVKDEETRLLPSLQQVAQGNEAVDIGRKWEALTGRVGTRPHPEAPQRGDACLAANNAVADSDKMYDEARFGHATPSHPGAYTDEMIPQLGLKKEELVQDMYNKHDGLRSSDPVKPEDETMMQ